MARQKTIYTTTALVRAFLTEEERYRRIKSGNLFQSGNALYINDGYGCDYCVAVKHPKFILCDYWGGAKRRSFMWALRICMVGNAYQREPMTGRTFIELRGILPWSGPGVDVGEAIALSETLDLSYHLVQAMRWYGRDVCGYYQLREAMKKEAELATRLKKLGLKGKCEITKPFTHTLATQLGMFILTGKRQEVEK